MTFLAAKFFEAYLL